MKKVKIQSYLELESLKRQGAVIERIGGVSYLILDDNGKPKKRKEIKSAIEQYYADINNYQTTKENGKTYLMLDDNGEPKKQREIKSAIEQYYADINNYQQKKQNGKTYLILDDNGHPIVEEPDHGYGPKR